MPTINPISDLELMVALAEGEESAQACGWVSLAYVVKKLGVSSWLKSVSHRKRLPAKDEGALNIRRPWKNEGIAMKAATLAKIARKQLKLIGASENEARINLKANHDGSAHIEDHVNGQIRYACSERGEEYNIHITNNPDDILYLLYQTATFEMACKWEVRNRIKGQDYRILLFSKQLELLNKIGSKYSERRNNEIAVVLKNNPYEETE